MRLACRLTLLLLLMAGIQWLCQGADSSPSSLPAARQAFRTKLQTQNAEKTPVKVAPPKLFLTVKYPAVVGRLAAYITPDPGDGNKHPAIIWITGGDCNSVDDVWAPAPRANDQTAAAYRRTGIVMMFPSLRGGNDNPGVKEGG